MPLEPSKRVEGRPAFLPIFALFFGLCGFAIAQSVYELILGTPEFLIARQNSRADLWWLTAALSLALPTMLTLLVSFLGKISGFLGRAAASVLAGLLSALFFAQLLQSGFGENTPMFLVLCAGAGAATAAALLFTPFRLLGPVLALLAVSFPLLFLLRAPTLSDGAVELPPVPELAAGADAVPIVMVLADELPLATVLDENGEIDARLFPNLHDLQQTSTWYRNTTTVADGTLEAVSAILTGRLPLPEAVPATIASLPYNLFTYLPARYRFNVTESLSRMCPRDRCPAEARPASRRFGALLLDLAALYLHRVAPADWRHILPDVSNNWSGFFAEKQAFFPGGWVSFAEGQALADRPGIFRRFIDSIDAETDPQLNFIHILYPHVPFVYLPDGRNYGNHWLRGLEKGAWGDSPWGVLSGKQRHLLQARHFDVLLGELLQRLRSTGLFERCLFVLVSDHGAAFREGDERRALSDRNAADILRVPLMIKQPGQRGGEISDAPVMTVDLLPTLLGSIGMDVSTAGFDGIDLRGAPPASTRSRPVLSYQNRDYRQFDAAELDVAETVRKNRRQLRLDEPESAQWAIGPLREVRGRPLDALCREHSGGVRFAPSALNPLGAEGTEGYIGAFVSGTLAGEVEGEAPLTFVITRDDRIVASGETWFLRGTHHYFALVEPAEMESETAETGIWLVQDGVCRGQLSP